MDLEREKDENQIELTPDKIGDIRFENVSFRYGTRVNVFEKPEPYHSKGKVHCNSWRKWIGKIDT